MFYNKIRCIGKVGKTEKLANNLQMILGLQAPRTGRFRHSKYPKTCKILANR